MNSISPYYKAVAAFVGSLVALLVALNIPVGFFADSNVQSVVVSLIASILPTIVVYLTPNHKVVAVAPAVPNAPAPASKQPS